MARFAAVGKPLTTTRAKIVLKWETITFKTNCHPERSEGSAFEVN
jgi:hypothetical protein